MIIVSVYSSEDSATAFVRLSSEGEKIRLLEVWKSQGEGESLFTAIKKTEPDSCFFNGVLVGAERHSFLAELAKSKQIRGVEIATPFHSSEGMEIFWDVQARKVFDPRVCEQWPKLAAKLERIETRKTAQPMALLQGLIAAEKEMRRDSGPALYGYERLHPFLPGQDQGIRTAYGVFGGSTYRSHPPI